MLKRLSVAAALFCLATVPALAGPAVAIYKAPGCECCEQWAAYLRDRGYSVTLSETDKLDEINAKAKLPDTMESCHTAFIDGYVVEGHVPAEAIAKLLAERPKVTGIAAPGMPQGSPGMSGRKEHFTVYAFGPDGAKPFMSF